MPQQLNKMRSRSNEIERRSYPFRVRANTDGTSQVLEGYAAVFERETVLIPKDAMWKGSPEVREVIEPGAFAKTLKNHDQRAFWNHNSDIILGRTHNRTLKLWEDDRGLGTEIKPPETNLVRDMVMAPIERGDVDQMSFGFSIVREARAENEDGSVTYTLKEVRLYEVSPVAIPAYPDTEIQISARSQERLDTLMEQRRLAANSAPGDDPLAHPDASAADSTPYVEPMLATQHLDIALRMRMQLEAE